MSKVLPDLVPSGMSKSILVFRLRSVSSPSILSAEAVGFTVVVLSPLSAPPIVISTFLITPFSEEIGVASASFFSSSGVTLSETSNTSSSLTSSTSSLVSSAFTTASAF